MATKRPLALIIIDGWGYSPREEGNAIAPHRGIIEECKMRWKQICEPEKSFEQEMLDYDGPVIFDCMVEKHENCLPMIPSGKPHNEMILPETEDIGNIIDARGKALV